MLICEKYNLMSKIFLSLFLSHCRKQTWLPDGQFWKSYKNSATQNIRPLADILKIGFSPFLQFVPTAHLKGDYYPILQMQKWQCHDLNQLVKGSSGTSGGILKLLHVKFTFCGSRLCFPTTFL